MIKSAELGKELAVTVVNEIGVLEDMAKIATEHGLNIEAVAGYAIGKEAKIMLVVDDSLRAGDALKKSGYNSIKENEVRIVELENKSGALKYITGVLSAEGIDIKQIYGSTCKDSCPAVIILSTSNNEKALVALKK